MTNFFNDLVLISTAGSRTYPVDYTYDAQGRMKTMKTRALAPRVTSD